MNSPPKITAAFFSYKIQRAIAKQAVKIPFRFAMTREKHAFIITKKSMIVLHLKSPILEMMLRKFSLV